MKKLNLIVAVALFVSALASVSFAEDKVTGDVYAGPYNKYIFRGLDLSGNQMVIQGGADLSYKNFTLSIWGNWQSAAPPFESTLQSSTITETDYTLNYTYSPTDLVTLNVGNTFYSLNSKDPNIRDTNELYLKTTLNTLLSPTASIYWDYDESHGTAGLFFSLAAAHTFEITKELGVNLGGLISYNCDNYSAGPFKGWQDWELSVSADYAVTPAIKVSPLLQFSNAMSGTSRDHGVSNEFLYGIKAAFIF